MPRKGKYSLRKNEILIAKIFNIDQDGEWYEANHKMYTKFNPEYLENKLKVYVKKKANCELPVWWYKKLTDNKYIVIFRTVGTSRICKALMEYGFERIA